MSVFTTDSIVQIFSVSKNQKSNNFKLAERLNFISGWDGAAVSIEDCGSSDPGATPGLDLSTYRGLL